MMPPSLHEKIIDIVRNKPFIDDTFLNINIPNIPHEKLNGFMVTKLGKRIYNDEVT